jgi:hypothetical protein
MFPYCGLSERLTQISPYKFTTKRELEQNLKRMQQFSNNSAI